MIVIGNYKKYPADKFPISKFLAKKYSSQEISQTKIEWMFCYKCEEILLRTEIMFNDGKCPYCKTKKHIKKYKNDYQIKRS
ncbi:MAG: hypothetical protein AABY22_06240 [Nanoarchaeota archaeon]